jgi:hypothetical protein
LGRKTASRISPRKHTAKNTIAPKRNASPNDGLGYLLNIGQTSKTRKVIGKMERTMSEKNSTRTKVIGAMEVPTLGGTH